jgi:Reverse transcriptase (RNA-dependent DNA polymerase)
MIEVIGENGCEGNIKDILNGQVPIHIPKYPRLLLSELQKTRNTIPLDMTIEDMCTGFSKWRENTTTSPSGKHLGIYKAHINARRFNILTPTEIQNCVSYDSTTTTPIAYQCLRIQFLLMTMAIDHCHTYQRWKVVHNFLLEKIPGLPFLDKLRVIHIYEEDWSLIQKYYIAHKLNNIAAKEKTAPIEQAGGRPGRNAIELAASRTLTYEAIRLQRLQGAVLYNDAKACYDRIIENISNLTLLKEGLPIQIAQLHAQTLSQIKYHIKHRYGIGTTTHGHKEPKPLYGVGQGATDSPARWGFLCDPLLNLYKKLATNARLQAQISKATSNNKIAGFVDDTALLLLIQVLEAILILFLERDSQTWERLLHTSGGKLEIAKCAFALFSWVFDDHGRA